MIQAPENIVTPRLLLRKPVPDDAPAVFQEYAHDPEVTRYLTWKPDQTLREVIAFIERAAEGWKKGTTFTWALTLKETGGVIGMIDARVDAYMVNLGYVLGKQHWNKGYATEALQAVLEWTNSEKDVYRVWAVCAVENATSARVMEKAGMCREGILRRWMVFPNIGGTPLDCYCYSHVKNEL
jgi:RimJ/RimL family protein N-acetyltransferase